MTVATVESPGAVVAASGLRRTAVALVALGPERAAVLLRGMSEDEVTAVAREIADLGEVTPEEVRATLAELGRGVRSAATLPAPGRRFAQDLLVQALGAERGGVVLATLDRPEPFRWLADADPATAAGVLAGEPPSAVALALAHLEPKSAAALLVRLPEQRRSTVAARLASLGSVHPDTLLEVEAGLRARVEAVRSVPVLPLAGPALLAGMLAKAGKDTSGELLEQLAAASPELAEEVRAALFTFDDLCAIDPKQMQLLLREVDMRQLAVAIASSTSSVQARFTGALSERARESLLEEVDLARGARPAEVNEARTALVAVARGLEEAGTLVLRDDEDED